MSIHTYFSEHGFPLVAVLDVAALPANIQVLMQKVPLANYQRLVLTANVGQSLWPHLEANWPQSAHPVDDYSRKVTQTYIAQHLQDDTALLLYPTAEYLIPLQQLGTFAGWHHPSPMGVAIHPEFGLWVAYRTAFLTSVALPVTPRDARPSPCESCVEKPCLAACPPQAITADAPIQLTACLDHRIAPGATCADRCLARMACPVGEQYTLPQIQYHYTQGFDRLKQWHLSQRS